MSPTRQRADDALAEAVVGDVAQAELLPRATRTCASTGAAEQARPRRARRARWPGDHLGQRALAVAVDARDAEDLALRAARARRPRCPSSAPSPCGADALAARARVSASTRAAAGASRLDELSLLQLGDVRATARASSPNMIRTISARSSSCALERSASRSSVPASRPCRRIEIAVAERERLVQLVGDEDDRLALLLEPAEHLRQLGDALRREHRGRLVEDQDARAAPERLDDLDLLLVAEGEVGRLSRPGRPRRRAGRRARRGAAVRPPTSSRSRRVSPSSRFSSTVSAGISAECW